MTNIKQGMERMANIKRSALMSNCGRYRYDLKRKWNDAGGSNKFVMFVGLNPSTADDEIDDQTMRRLIGFAALWGYGELVMTNLFAYRATEPQDMKKAESPIGSENNKTLLEYAEQADVIVFCWGSHGNHHKRSDEVVSMLRLHKDKTYCFGFNNNGEPKHPLYLKGSTKLIKFSGE